MGCLTLGILTGAVELGPEYGQHRLLTLKLAGPFGKCGRLRIQFGSLAIEAFGLGAKPLLLGGRQTDRFFPFLRIALQLLQPHIHVARSFGRRAFLLLDSRGATFESNEIILKLRAIPLESRSLGLEFLFAAIQVLMATGKGSFPTCQPLGFGCLPRFKGRPGFFQDILIGCEKFALARVFLLSGVQAILRGSLESSRFFGS